MSLFRKPTKRDFYLVWAVQRARWHRGVEDAARMTQTDGDVV